MTTIAAGASVTERPILFSAPMVLALLQNRKKKTRRVVKWVPREEGLNLKASSLEVGHYCTGLPSSGFVLRSRGGACWNDRTHPVHCPYGEVGDRLWVREAWRPRGCEMDACDCEDVIVSYSADGKETQISARHIPEEWVLPVAAARGNVSPLFMPRWASRLTLEITEVKVERLQAISEEDAVAEGIIMHPNNVSHPELGVVAAFHSLWDQIHAKNDGLRWDDNPWVWVISFEVLK